MVVDVARFLPAPRGIDAPDDAGAASVETRFEDEPQPGSSARSDFPAVIRQPPGADIRRRLTGFLGKHTRQTYGDDLRAWRRWIWAQPYAPHPDYAAFKAEVYVAHRSAFPGLLSAARRRRSASTKSTGAASPSTASRRCASPRRSRRQRRDLAPRRPPRVRRRRERRGARLSQADSGVARNGHRPGRRRRSDHRLLHAVRHGDSLRQRASAAGTSPSARAACSIGRTS